MAPLAVRWGDDADSDEDSVVGGRETTTTSPSSESVAIVDDTLPPSSSKGGGGVAIPPTHTTRVDSKGIKVVTSYRRDPANPARLLKTTTSIRVAVEKVRESISVNDRRKWSKFGQAALDANTENVTIHSRDDIYMENPHADVDLQEEDDVAKALSGNLNAFWAKHNMRTLQRKYDVDGDDDNNIGGADKKNDGGGGEDGWTQVGAGSGSA